MNNTQNNQWLSQLILDLATLMENKNLNLCLSKFYPVQVTLNSQTVDKSELSSKLNDMGEVTGWVQATSEVQTLDNDYITLESTLLNGEWVDTQGVSHQVEYIGHNQWLLQSAQIIKIAEDNTDSATADNTYLAEKITHLKVQNRGEDKNSPRKLVYQKLWALLDSAPVAKMAFFTGFE